MQIYCIERGESINPRSMNADVVEWFFGDGRQIVGGSTRKMTARQLCYVDFKAAAFNAGKHNLIGNNASDKNHFGREKRF